jgi:hypothetical protein
VQGHTLLGALPVERLSATTLLQHEEELAHAGPGFAADRLLLLQRRRNAIDVDSERQRHDANRRRRLIRGLFAPDRDARHRTGFPRHPGCAGRILGQDHDAHVGTPHRGPDPFQPGASRPDAAAWSIIGGVIDVDGLPEYPREQRLQRVRESLIPM